VWALAGDEICELTLLFRGKTHTRSYGFIKDSRQGRVQLTTHNNETRRHRRRRKILIELIKVMHAALWTELVRDAG
jgi:hypothetical protein